MAQEEMMDLVCVVAAIIVIVMLEYLVEDFFD